MRRLLLTILIVVAATAGTASADYPLATSPNASVAVSATYTATGVQHNSRYTLEWYVYVTDATIPYVLGDGTRNPRGTTVSWTEDLYDLDPFYISPMLPIYEIQACLYLDDYVTPVLDGNGLPYCAQYELPGYNE